MQRAQADSEGVEYKQERAHRGNSFAAEAASRKRLDESGSAAFLLDMCRKRAQAAENLAILGIVRPQLESVVLGNGQRQFQCVNGIETKLAFTEQGRIRVDRFRFNAFDVEAADHEFGEFEFGR